MTDLDAALRIAGTLAKRNAEKEKRDKQRQYAADLRTGLSPADVVASVFRRDTERVLSTIEEKGFILTTYGTSSVMSNLDWSAYRRTEYVLLFLEECGVIYSDADPGRGTTWRRVGRPS